MAPAMKVLGLPGSPNSLGPILFALQNDLGGFDAKFPHSDEIKAVNPWGLMPAMEMTGEGCEKLGGGIGETNAILRAQAMSGKVESAYPCGSDVSACALIDFALDKFATGGAYKGFVQTIYPLFGYAKYTTTPAADAEKLKGELELFFKRFYPVEGKFVGGAEEPTIADYRIAPFVFCWLHAKSPVASCAAMAGPGKAFLEAFEKKMKPEVFGMLKGAGGHAVGELLEKAVATPPADEVPAVVGA